MVNKDQWYILWAKSIMGEIKLWNVEGSIKKVEEIRVSSQCLRFFFQFHNPRRWNFTRFDDDYKKRKMLYLN